MPVVLNWNRTARNPWAWCVSVVALAFLLQLGVVWSVHFPPQVDTPNHMARHSLESRAWFGEPLPPFYAIRYRLVPNLGGDLLIPLLLRVWEPIVASKVFLSLAIVLSWVGPAVFILQVGRYQLSALLAALFLLPFNLSNTFFWGFLNFYSGLGLAFLLLCHLTYLRRRAKAQVWGLTLHSLLVTLLFFWHLAAFGVYGVLMSCQVLVDILQSRRDHGWRGSISRVIAFVLPVLPAAALVAIYSLTVAGGGTVGNAWGGWSRKLEAVFTLFRGYHRGTDLVVLALWLAALWVMFGVPRFSRNWALLGTVILLAMYLIMPFQWHSTSSADVRLLPALLVCSLAVVGTSPARNVKLAFLILVICLVVRHASIYSAWQRLDSRLRAEAPAFDLLPERSRVLPIVLITEESRTKEHPEVHFAAWAVAYREIYLPSLFALGDQCPLTLNPARRVPSPSKMSYEDLLSKHGGLWTTEILDEKLLRQQFDFLWVYNPGSRSLAIPPTFVRIFARESVTLWRIPR